MWHVDRTVGAAARSRAPPTAGVPRARPDASAREKTPEGTRLNASSLDPRPRMSDRELLQLRELLASTPDCAVSRPAKLQSALQAFVSLNEDASRSPNYQSQARDDLDSVIKLLSSDAVKAHDQLLLYVLKMLKILSRKYDNRVRLGEHIVDDLVEVCLTLPLAMTLSPTVALTRCTLALTITLTLTPTQP